MKIISSNSLVGEFVSNGAFGLIPLNEELDICHFLGEFLIQLALTIVTFSLILLMVVSISLFVIAVIDAATVNAFSSMIEYFMDHNKGFAAMMYVGAALSVVVIPIYAIKWIVQASQLSIPKSWWQFGRDKVCFKVKIK